MLAEKVETQEEYAAAMQMGYSLFQGYFFCRPEMMQHRALPSFKLAYLELLRAATAPEFDIQELASKIKHEASLIFRLLRYLNSAAFGLRSEIHSVPHALSLLGERELRKWIAVVSVGVLAEGKPDELMTVPLIRGRFCELLAPLAGMPGTCERSVPDGASLRDGRDPRPAARFHLGGTAGAQRNQGSARGANRIVLAVA